MAVVYLAAHLPFLASTLEDVDSVNFALGLRDYDPAQHQPHPPGSPVYIALGRLSLAVVRALGRHLSRPSAEAMAFAFWSALAGAAAVVLAHRLFSLLMACGAHRAEPAQAPLIGRFAETSRPERHRVALWSTFLLGCSPLFWMSGVRPMSDMPGLALALAAQALLIHATLPLSASGRWLMAGAFVSGVAIGVRSQTLWLTFPLFVYAMVRYREPRRFRGILWACAAYAVAILAWGVPLLAAIGGLSVYLDALSMQAGEDFAFVDMLWANPTPRQLAVALYRTFVLPWGVIPLAVAVLTAAAIGGAVVMLRERQRFVLMLIAFGPYVVLDLAFQDTATVRYALPIMPVVAFLAARGLGMAGRATCFIATPVVVGALIVSVPGVVAYGAAPHPAFRALEDAGRRAETRPPALLTAHVTLRRAVTAANLQNVPVRLPPPGRERLEAVNYWAGGGTGPVWFLADPKRTDLDLIDPASRLDVVRYRWNVGSRAELAGTRPLDADWYRLNPPGWFLSEGWSLTPETGGIATATGKGPHHGPIVGYVRRRQEPVRLMIGGRYLSEVSEGPTDFELAIDGTVMDRWRLTFEQRNFLRFLTLPDGVAAGPGQYARLTVVSQPVRETDGRPIPVAVRQFDIQPASRLVYGFGEGWHEAEYRAETGLRWRWTSDRSVLEIRGPVQPVRIILRGESPLRYFDAPPTVRIRAGGRVIAQFLPSSDFDWTVTVPAEAAAPGRIILETDRVFVPAEVDGSPDSRRLGLRIFECAVQPVR